jgi:hypothetical protein
MLIAIREGLSDTEAALASTASVGHVAIIQLGWYESP